MALTNLDDVDYRTGNYIQSYGDKGFKIRGKWYPLSLMLTQSQLQEWTFKNNIETLAEDDLSLLFENKDDIEVFLLGTGSTLVWPPMPLLNALKAQNIYLEVMDTPAACRTNNLLLSEGRKLLSLLFLS